MLFLRNRSTRSSTAALANPRQAGLAYVSLDTTVDWKTDWRLPSLIPCDLRTRRAYSAWPDDVMIVWTCCSIEKLLEITTPSIFMLETLATSGNSGTTTRPLARSRGLLNTISWDFLVFSRRLLAVAQFWTFVISADLLHSFEAGMTR